MMSGIRRLLGEPLVQFLLIGVVLFAAYGVLTEQPADQTATETIVVSPGRIAHLSETFSRTWQRPPTDDELKGLIDTYVKEEIYYREGRKLGLDLDDTVFRRRLQQKMEFLLEPDEDQLTPEDGELQAFLDDNADAFELPGKVAFRQVFFDPARHDDINADVAAALSALNDGAEPETVGDATLLPGMMALATDNQIAGTFGVIFFDGLADLPANQWSGPIPSTFGLHLVRVEDREPPRKPALDEVIGSVTREWIAEQRAKILADRYTTIRDTYTVVIEEPEERQSADSDTTAPET